MFKATWKTMAAPSKPPNAAASRSRKKWLWLALGLVPIGLVVGMLCWPAGDRFEVNGVPFRVWLAQHPDFQVADPLAAVGTNAIPSLVRILREPAGSSQVYAAKAFVWRNLPPRLRSRFPDWYPVPPWQLKRSALFALRALGPEARPALPDVLRVGRLETNRMEQAGAIVAALAIAPDSPETFQFWREQWEANTYSHDDLAIYLRAAHYPITAAVPLLLEDLKRRPGWVTTLEAFEFMGEAARPAVPDMIQALNHGTYRGNILSLLMRLGPVAADAVPDIVSFLNDDLLAADALQALKAMGPAARSSVPALEPLLTNSEPGIRMLAAAAVARIQEKPDLAVPILLDGLHKPQRWKDGTFLRIQTFHPIRDMPESVTSGADAAAILVGECGPPARAALPTLEQGFKNGNEWIRLSSAQAYWRISGDVDNTLPVLLEMLHAPRPPDTGINVQLVRVIEVVEEMGPAATNAIPALLKLRTYSMPVRHAVDHALARIQSAPAGTGSRPDH